jgi:hypothetical protein
MAAHSELQRLRFPPTGDPPLWVRFGPNGPAGLNPDGRVREIIEHTHTADAAGGDCPVCGFPWWPRAAAS